MTNSEPNAKGPFAAGRVPYPPDCVDCPSPAECKAANDCQVVRQIRHPNRKSSAPTPSLTVEQIEAWRNSPNDALNRSMNITQFRALCDLALRTKEAEAEHEASWRQWKALCDQKDVQHALARRLANAAKEAAESRAAELAIANEHLMGNLSLIMTALQFLDEGTGPNTAVALAQKAASKNAALASQLSQAKRDGEKAWFLERIADRSFPPRPYERWLQSFNYEYPAWTNNPLLALRFCRKQDVQALCKAFGIPALQKYAPFATEHIFIDAAMTDAGRNVR